jgi:hypothetical protein
VVVVDHLLQGAHRQRAATQVLYLQREKDAKAKK